MTKIAIINYEVGNIKSIFNAFKYMGLKVDIIDNPWKLFKQVCEMYNVECELS